MRKFSVTKHYIAKTLDEVDEKSIDSAIRLIFDHGEEDVDESVSLDCGRISTSSYANGIIDWNEEQKQYVLSRRMSKYPLGQLKEIIFSDEP